MKKVVFIITLSLLSWGTVFSQVSQQEAFERIQEFLGEKCAESEIAVFSEVMHPGEAIAVLGSEPLLAKSESWLFFIDEQPYANWGHSCVYAFVDCRTERVDTVHHVMPPAEAGRLEMMKRVVPLREVDPDLLFNIPYNPQAEVAPNNYAVIISGGANMHYNYERYWNDCSAIYKVLRNKYHYSRNKIYVLMSDGTDPGLDMRKLDGSYASSPLDLDGDGIDDIQYSATKANIAQVFNTLQQRVTSNDNVFIFTTDHGGSGSTLNLWGETMTTVEFAAEVNKVSVAKSINVCMEQCYSGGYTTALAGNNRVIATACAANESSWAMNGGVYDEFSYHWTAAVAGQTPNGTPVNADYNNDGYVSMDEAFEYARTHDTRPETPQYSAPYIPNLGPYLTLFGVLPHHVDLMIRDSVGDIGTVPSGVVYMWHSPDIWLEDMNGNLIASPHGNTECKVCVRVTNRGDMPSYGGERLFVNWAKAGCDLRWSHNWSGDNYFNCGSTHPRKGGPVGNADGTVIPIVPAHGSVVVKVTWSVPLAEDYQNCTQFASDLWHFCLTARVHDDYTIDGESATNLGMGYFTLYNNNVAWKNLSILNAQYPAAVVTVSNPYEEERGFSLHLNILPDKEGRMLYCHADVILRLDEELTERWFGAGAECKGGKYLGENKFIVKDRSFVLDGITLPPDHHYTVEASVKFYADNVVSEEGFVFDLIEKSGKEVIGAERFIAYKDPSRTFEAKILGEQMVLAGESLTLTAKDIGESAQYIWHTLDGDVIGEGMSLVVTPEATCSYVLEVVADADGYKNYDTAKIAVVDGAIVNLAPNPSNHQTVVAYRLADGVTGGMLILSNAAGLIVYSEPIDAAGDVHTIDLQCLSPGQYIVRMDIQGVVVDTAVLVVY